MRMEELSESRYIKSTDTVERYLLELVRQYFEGNNPAAETSREYIINKALERMKEEISLDGLGVLSVTVNGEVRTGAVSITLEDLMGEPWINPKRTAFNVDFGNEKGTACEGNDPRLYDRRNPNPHRHETSDIIGLDGILSTLTGKIARLNTLAHSHNNLKVLDMLIYTGDKSVIDLTLLDTMDDKISEIVNKIRDEISAYRKDIADMVKDIENQISDIEKKIDDLQQTIIEKNEEYYKKAVDYADDKSKALKDEFDKAVENFIEKDDIQPVLDAAKQTMSLAGSASVNLQDIIDFTGYQQVRSVTWPIPADILQNILDRSMTVRECQSEFLLSYANDKGVKVYSHVPYITFESGNVDGNLQVSNDDKNMYITYTSKVGNIIPDEIRNATLICNFYSRQDVTL